TAIGIPGGLVELETAVVTIATRRRPVAAGLALGQLVPHAAVRRLLATNPHDARLRVLVDFLVDDLAVGFVTVVRGDAGEHDLLPGFAGFFHVFLTLEHGVVNDLLDRRVNRLPIGGDRAVGAVDPHLGTIGELLPAVGAD